MRKIPIHIIAVLLSVLAAAGTEKASAAGKERLFRSIEFQGLNYMSKYDIIRQVRAATTERGIVVDMDSLKSVLKGTMMIRDYDIRIQGDRLTVRIEEREPALPLAVTDGEKMLLLEFDANYDLVSRGKIYSADRPLIIIGREDIPGGVLSARVRRLNELMVWTGGAFPELYAELSEIFLSETGEIRVKLRKRRTDLYMRPGRDNIRRLNYVTGYLDRIRYYPERLDIQGNMIVIR